MIDGTRKKYVYGTKKDLVKEKEEIKCDNIMKKYNEKMFSFDDVTKENITEHNPNW